MKKISLIAVVWLVVGLAATASAAPFCYQVGDVDGFGFNASNQGTAVWPGPGLSGEPYDGRSPAEKVATDGAQLTDSYSSLTDNSQWGPVTSNTASVIIPLPADTQMTNGTFVVAMGDFQADLFGPIAVNFNGIAQNWAFADGFQVTTIRAFVLTPAEIAAANLAGQFICNLDRSNSSDFIAFDWFKLCADVVPVPIPGSLMLLASGIIGLVGKGVRRKSS